MYCIYTVIDEATGEIILFTPDLLRQITEVKRLIEQVTVAQRTVRIRIGEQRVLEAAGDDLIEAFFEKRQF